MRSFIPGLISLCIICHTAELHADNISKYITKTATEGGYTYQYVTNDPLGTRIYTLRNGLKVYLSVYKNTPRIQTFVAVRTGSKNDPARTTGLAHYLEHMVFKGTSRIGALSYEKEKPFLDKIERQYELYRNTSDTLKRKAIYHRIDSLSGIAAKYATANEYDKLVSNIGAKGTNAYTWLDQTVYINDIPANQVEKWAMIESERFRQLVPRLFHTELEAVYEEKNRSLDNDNSKMWENMFAVLFPHHPYGTQTTIGTVEHLKNPSIKEIKNFFSKWYVPNNMAVCMSGDLDPLTTIRLLDKTFGTLKPGKIPPYKSIEESPIIHPVVRHVYGPTAESVSLGFRFAGYQSRDAFMLDVVARILFNGQAGLIDLNLNQKQLLLKGSAFGQRFHDYSMLLIGGSPREGQTLDEVKTLLLAQLDSLKTGHFDDDLIPSILNNAKVARMQELESNAARADAFVSAFINQVDWKEATSELDKYSKVTKQQVMDFARRHFKDNYALVYKHSGKDSTVKKISKPVITPVEVNRESSSAFSKAVGKIPEKKLKPVFLDFRKDITHDTVSYDKQKRLPVLYCRNTENGLFELYYLLDMGTFNDRFIGLAIQYLNYLGTKELSNEQVKKKFYKLGSSYGVFSGEDRTYVKLTGLQENFDRSVALFEELLANAQPNEEAYKKMVEGILKSRADSKKSKGTILSNGMVQYAKYGPTNPFTYIVTEEELRSLNISGLTDRIHQIASYPHRVLYFGPMPVKTLVKSLEKAHKIPTEFLPVPEALKFKQLDFENTQVYWTNYDMVQSEIVILSKSVRHDTTLYPYIFLFNEYFGDNMGSVIFQEIRESKALAYAASSRYQRASKPDQANYDQSYIGCQADKLPEALSAMEHLLDSMPVSASLLKTAKASVINSLETQRITKSGILIEYETARRLGFHGDMRKEIYKMIPLLTVKDIAQFHERYISKQRQRILVIGSKEKLSFTELEKYGPVQELKLEEIFGY